MFVMHYDKRFPINMNAAKRVNLTSAVTGDSFENAQILLKRIRMSQPTRV